MLRCFIVGLHKAVGVLVAPARCGLRHTHSGKSSTLWCSNVRQRQYGLLNGEFASFCFRQKRHTTRRPKRDATKADCSCMTFATADRYNLKELVRDIVKWDSFVVKNLPLEFFDATNIISTSSTWCKNPSFPGEIFIFRNGVISFWNIRGDAVESVLTMSRNHAEDIFPARLVNWESEEMPYIYHQAPTAFKDGKFFLCSDSSQDKLSLDMFALSNALCTSVKLGHWENKLDALISSLDTIPASLIKGQKLKYHTPQAMLRKVGEIQLIRHRVNLQHNLLDIPDTYWDHEDLEKLYLDTSRFLSIGTRVNLVNEKLNYCAHMVELLKTDLHEKRSLRLEVLIVLLISIEVVFEVVHLFIMPRLCNDPEPEVSRLTSKAE